MICNSLSLSEKLHLCADLRMQAAKFKAQEDFSSQAYKAFYRSVMRMTSKVIGDSPCIEKYPDKIPVDETLKLLEVSQHGNPILDHTGAFPVIIEGICYRSTMHALLHLQIGTHEALSIVLYTEQYVNAERHLSVDSYPKEGKAELVFSILKAKFEQYPDYVTATTNTLLQTGISKACIDALKGNS